MYEERGTWRTVRKCSLKGAAILHAASSGGVGDPAGGCGCEMWGSTPISPEGRGLMSCPFQSGLSRSVSADMGVGQQDRAV